jgi:hypothetical protein
MTGGKSFSEAIGLETDVAVDVGVGFGAWVAEWTTPAATKHALIRK